MLGLSVAGVPVWLFVYARLGGAIGPASAAELGIWLLVSGALGAAVVATTRDGAPPRPAAYAAAVAVAGFVVAATWIDAVADQLVQMLEFFGVARGVETGVLGSARDDAGGGRG